MEAARTSLTPGVNKRRRSRSPGEVQHLGSTPTQSHQHSTTLPSIRQLPTLQGYLTTTSPSLPHLSRESPPYSYPNMPYHSTGLDSGSSQLLGTPSQREASQREGAGAYGAGESEGDGDVALRGPLKKKRRRQALSCTECKRRKIKCDRTQPCTPCMRRGEEAGCQWHIVEPVEKYATKAEFEELKARYNELAALVHRLLPAPAAVAPYYQMGVQSSGMPGVPGEAVQSYNNPGTTSSSTAGAGGYSAIMPPPQPPQHQQQGSYSQHMETPTQVTSRLYIKPEEAHSPTRQHASHPHQSSLSVQNASPSTLASAGHNSILTRHRLPDSSPTLAASTVKMSPLSLSSITSPFHPDQQAQSQSKNCRAQTLILGEHHISYLDSGGAGSSSSSAPLPPPLSAYHHGGGVSSLSHSRRVSDPPPRSLIVPASRDDPVDRSRMSSSSSYLSGSRDR
ncbi:hypothetical protein D9613_006461 [Agrocybe pediades]|uniref:Zn(2)-C6 fungal-type domain-containing protein n=1 Tax=Agrocybe pediades TaxID=84607 RepID=A0A8H4VK14_9AGAR|nr:hypothetical protein D9613_006461 [Agrocybe pediades]